MKHGFLKVAAATPKVTVADPQQNARELLSLAKTAEKKKVAVLVFPELSLTGYTCSDLFFSETLLQGAKDALGEFLAGSEKLNLVSFVGLPLSVGDKLFNVCAVCQRGKLLGIVPKTNIPSYGEFSEGRYFAACDPAQLPESVALFGEDVPFGTDLIFSALEMPECRIGVEICEDLWVADSPAVKLTSAGATLICNLSASSETVSKADYRRLLVQSVSARTVSAYLYATCGEGESSTDLVFGGQNLIAENGVLLAETKPFDFSSPLLISEVDLQRIKEERRRLTTFRSDVGYTREIFFSLPLFDTELTRFVDPHPFVPADEKECTARCETILNIQAYGLKQRVERAYAKKLVIGISGGLDSTLALLVSARTMDLLGRSHKEILAVTMPGFGTTSRTKDNATVLCEELGVDFRCIPIGESVAQHFRDISHDPNNRNAAYENAQARERTQILMDLANDENGLVVGTGDLSELALGWATYNGDQMSMYGVNASVPKTLVRSLVSYCASVFEKEKNKNLASALRDVVDTPVSPELLPADGNGKIAQKTEDLVGPYELHDFYLYYLLRFGFSPAKLFRMAKYALGNVYTDDVLLHWLEVLVRRFFSQQFKRSCLPDGPKVGSVTLSPRGDWHMPSDASSALWLAEIEKLKK